MNPTTYTTTNPRERISAFYLVGGSSADEHTRCISSNMPLLHEGWSAQMEHWVAEVQALGLESLIVSNPWGRDTINTQSPNFHAMEFDARLRAERFGLTMLTNRTALYKAIGVAVSEQIRTTFYLGSMAHCELLLSAPSIDAMMERLIACLDPLHQAACCLGFDAVASNVLPGSPLDVAFSVLRAAKLAAGLDCYGEALPREPAYAHWAQRPLIATRGWLRTQRESILDACPDVTVLLHIDGELTRPRVIESARWALARGWKVAVPPHILRAFDVQVDQLVPLASEPAEQLEAKAARRADGNLA